MASSPSSFFPDPEKELHAFPSVAVDSTNTWLFARIYAPMSLTDDIVLDLVGPVERELHERNLIAQYFFIRYGEGGPHLRLRFRGTRHNLMGPVRGYLNQSIEDFFAKRQIPLQGPLDMGPDGMEDTQWQPHQPHHEMRPIPSYEYDRYEPEVERYGGSEGMLVTEAHFQFSSTMVSQILTREKMGDGPRQNAALLLMEATTRAFGLSEREQLDAFGRQCIQWLQTPFLHKEHLKRFSSDYEQYRHALYRLMPVGQTHRPEHRSRAIWTPCLEAWNGHLAELVELLRELDRRTVLTTSLLQLMHLYIHMLCNRLGILVREEACLAYFLYRSYAEQLSLPADLEALSKTIRPV